MEGMMCLGRGWDSKTSKYSKTRQIDNAVAPDIPREVLAMVRRVMLDAQARTEKKHAAGNVEDILPMVSPDICIVQLYTAHGQLRFHQVQKFEWDVFFSFKGEDTRSTFTSQLHDALRDKGIRTFMDNEGLSSGGEIVPKLVEAIHDSAAGVAIISKKYAGSRHRHLQNLLNSLNARSSLFLFFTGSTHLMFRGRMVRLVMLFNS